MSKERIPARNQSEVISKDFGGRIEFYPFVGNTFTAITVYKPHQNIDEGTSPATVNWPAIGAVTGAEAIAFGLALGLAGQEANELNIQLQRAAAMASRLMAGEKT